MKVLSESPVVARPASAAHVEPIGRRNLAVESLRGVAALGVVAYHLSKVIAWGHGRLAGGARLVFANGDAGVTLFFVLSGFLLFRPYAAAALDRGDRPSLRGFARNRVLRIVPAYWASLTLVLLFVSGSRPAGVAAWPYYLFLQNYSRRAHLGVIAPAWSLAVEAVFYIVLPVFGYACWRACRRVETRAGRARVLIACVSGWFALGVADKLYWVLVRHRPARDVFTYFQFLPKAHLFALGMLLAIWHARDRAASPLRGRRPWVAPLAGAMLVVLASVMRENTFTTAAMFDTLTGLGFFLIVSGVAFDGDGHTRLSRALHTRPLVWVGTVSYSLYLVHERLLRLLVRHAAVRAPLAWLGPDVVVLVVASLAASWALYTFVEKPFLRLRTRWS